MIQSSPLKSLTNYLGQVDQFPTSEYVISAIVESLGKGINSKILHKLFRFTSNPSRSDDLSQCGSRLPVFQYKRDTESLGLSIIAKTKNGIREKSIDYKQDLVWGEDAYVTLVSLGNEISICINRILIQSKTALLNDWPTFEILCVLLVITCRLRIPT